ncbi:hypothetical protein GCM10018785_69190 [Streptomyces longispororuber]|uniref:STAS domain-containing protein n=2 Tax=Streptomyces longispororuber TaxID=68230 RepID=A0A919A951_9ACTN|nr:hypothetical protein GCM10018785_69190 [Streptomyces longispororuber]
MLPAPRPGLILHGEVLAAHKGVLTKALLDCGQDHDVVTLDLTGVSYLSNAALQILVVFAQRLTPPRHLLVRSPRALDLQERLTRRDWNLATLRVVPV